MLLVPSKTLQEGMVLAQPIFHPAREELVLLAPEYKLDQAMIERVAAMGVSHVWVHFPGLEEIDPHVNPALSEGHMKLYHVVEGSINKLERRVAVRMNLHLYKKSVGNMLTQIIENPEHEVVTHQLAACSPTLAGHLANCCYLSLLVGAHMSGYLQSQRRALPVSLAENTSLLGLGALLHDIGKIDMPDDLASTCILDEEASWPEYQMHSQAGADAIRDAVSPVVVNVVLNHHQRFDGMGFPAGTVRGSNGDARMAGERIHIFGRIVAVCDIFDRLICPHGEPVPTIVAIRALRSDQFSGWFDPVVVQKFLELVPPFVVGSSVTLCDGKHAVVIENHPEAPCRPTVKLLSGPVGQPGVQAQAKRLDLRMARKLSIAAVDGVDVREHVFSGELEHV